MDHILVTRGTVWGRLCTAPSAPSCLVDTLLPPCSQQHGNPRAVQDFTVQGGRSGVLTCQSLPSWDYHRERAGQRVVAQKAVVMKVCSGVQRLYVVWWGQPGRGREQMPLLRLTFGPALLLPNKAIKASPRTLPSIGDPLPSTQAPGHSRPL